MLRTTKELRKYIVLNGRFIIILREFSDWMIQNHNSGKPFFTYGDVDIGRFTDYKKEIRNLVSDLL